MPNQYVNKVQRVVDGETETIIDITSDTVSTDSLASGYTAHAANGAPIVGTLHVPPDMVVLSYGTSTWADFIAAFNTNSVVYCRASSNANPATGTQGRMAFMAYVSYNSGGTPTSVEFQYYRSVSNHTATQQGDQVFVYTLNSSSTWSVTTREAASKIVAGENMTSSYSDGTLTLNADGYTLPTMAANTKGGAKLGAGLSVADDTLSLSGESYTSAEKTKLAGIEANANNYTLPTMGASTKGGAKLGDGLSVSNDVLSVDVSDVASGQLPIAHGGTGASTAAAALTALGAASQDDMDDAEQAIADNAAAIATLGESVSLKVSFTDGLAARIATASSSGQCFVIEATVINTNNAARLNHKLQLVITNTGISLYDATAKEFLWAK